VFLVEFIVSVKFPGLIRPDILLKALVIVIEEFCAYKVLKPPDFGRLFFVLFFPSPGEG